MKTQIPIVIAIIFTLCNSAFSASEGIPDRPVEIDQINDHLYVITVTGGEEYGLPPFGSKLIASIGHDGIMLVDDGFNWTGQKLYDTLKALSNRKVNFIINTHYHGDHAFGNKYFKKETAIISHKNAMNSLSGNFFHLKGIPNENCPMIGFDDSLLINFNGETIYAVHAPACHTNGDVYVYFYESKIVAAGDLFFPDEIPFIDLLAGGSIDGYIAQIDNFLNNFPDDTKFIAAHGRYYDKKDLVEYKRMLMETTSLVKKAIAEGKSLDDAIAGNILADWNKWEGSFPTTTFQVWIQTIYSENSSIETAKISICDPLTKILKNESAEKTVFEYNRMKAEEYDKYDFGENQLNVLGYQLLSLNRVDDAIKIFELNIESFPAASNVYDSYAEALLVKGDTAASIFNYKKSLELNPENTNAAAFREKLKKSE